MPRPPDIDPSGKLNFIANYILMGCSPPFFVVIECAREPIEDLAMLFLLPDLVDIGQAIFDPKGGRRRKPGRHGRKRRRAPGFPDISDIVGQRVRADINPYIPLGLGKFTLAFRVWNLYEAIAITVAILEGLTDIGYTGLLGVMELDPTHCQEFGRLVKEDPELQLAGGAGPSIWPIAVQHVEVASGFQHTAFGCMCPTSDYVVHFRTSLKNNSSNLEVYGDLALGVQGGPVKALSSIVSPGPGDSLRVEVSATFEQGTWCEWGVGNRLNNPVVLSREIVAFSKASIPWPF